MSLVVDIDEQMNRFRVASRELYNNFFRVPDPYRSNGWEPEERFSAIESLLFKKMVIEPAMLPEVEYGRVCCAISVQLRADKHAPIMINREINSGYWDYPVDEVTADVGMSFMRFFDWDQLDYRSYQYVRVRIDRWPSRSEVVGKHALVESQHVRFAKAPDS